MIRYTVVLLLLDVVLTQSCHWNDGCVYQLYSSKTPYDAVRGDIRDYPVPQNCQAVSIWSLNRHGNRNPGNSATEGMRVMAGLKQEIVDSYYAGRGELCAQDIDNFKQWSWNETLEVSQSYLTGTGYEEIYDIARRLAEKYPQLLEGTDDDYYIRSTNEQRTVTSAIAFMHGWTANTTHSLVNDGPWDRDDIIRPYENCDRYQQEVKNGAEVNAQIEAYMNAQDYLTVQQNVQRRLGITTQLSGEDIYFLYELCRFYRSWEKDLRSPWCAAFSEQDLVIVEYRDDVRHYYRNGYGSWVNVDLGKLPAKDLFDRMNDFVRQGQGKKMVAYFTHDTMIEMMLCALGLFKDADGVIQGAHRDPNRLWWTSKIGCFSANIMAVLNSCEDSGSQSYRVQIFVNEQVTELCPLEGCSWQEFLDKFQPYSIADLQFCSMDARLPADTVMPDSAATAVAAVWMMALGLAVNYWR